MSSQFSAWFRFADYRQPMYHRSIADNKLGLTWYRGDEVTGTEPATDRFLRDRTAVTFRDRTTVAACLPVRDPFPI